MTNSKHTPTPWYWGDKSHHGYFNLRSDSGIVINAEENYGAPYMEISDEDAAHIVKCVNMHDELVEALESVLEGIKLGYNLGYLESEVEEALKKAGAL